MKKGRLFLPLFLTVAICFASLPINVPAEEEGYEEYQDDGGDQENNDDGSDENSGAEHVDAYYETVQTNEISGWPQGDAVDSEGAIVMDAETGAILYGKNIDEKEYPASITKIMTVLLALEKGNLEDVVTFSEYAVYSIEFGSSHLGLTEGEQLTLEQCLYGIMLASANEISNGVAEHIGGDVDTFVQMMNDKAAQLGCTNTHFVNPHGLYDENHYTCARDMALIMQAALKNDKFREIIHTVEYHYPETNKVDEERWFVNHHRMISEEGWLYDGCVGGKTGYTDESWNTLVTDAKREDLELICVVLRCPGLDRSYEDTKILLDYGFANFKQAQIKNNEIAKDSLEISGIEDQEEISRIRQASFLEEPFSMAETTDVTIPKEMDTSVLTNTMDFSSGTLTYAYQGQELGRTSFTYTGEWKQETEASTETVSESESETESETEKVVAVSSQGKNKVLGAVSFIYGKMDEFIKQNTVIASIIGAVLLMIFIPLLLVAVNRNRRYRRIMELRRKELEQLRLLEEEIEKKSAAQVEAELRAGELQMMLEEEKKKRHLQEEEMKQLEDSMGFYLDEDEEVGEETAEPEDEFIEVPLEEADKYK